MIASIKGIVKESSPLMVVIETNGIGYEINIPLNVSETIPPLGQETKLHIVPVFREDSQNLYGFNNKEQKDFFKLLIEKVSGVGPKVALSIMSKLSLDILKHAIANSDTKLLSQCPGIGKKTAERLTLELKDKVVPNPKQAPIAFPNDSSPNDSSNITQDAIKALITLGYSPAIADKTVHSVLNSSKDKITNTESLIRLALA